MKNDPPIPSLLQGKAPVWQQVSGHVLGWLAFISLIVLSRPQQAPFPEKVDLGAFPLLLLLWQVALFYFNAYFLIPRIMYRVGWGSYLLGCLAVVSAGFVWMYQLYPFTPFASIRQAGVVASFFPLAFPQMLILGMSTAFRLAMDRVAGERLRQEAENINLHTELAFLRSQISPHFLFNVLNGVVSLARKQSNQVEPMLIQLSALMRYMLYETDARKVLLSHEWAYLESYIQLQQMRFGTQLQVQVEKNLTFPEALIEPMLLIPFLENAFKHGTRVVGQPTIGVRCYQEGKTLHFMVKNIFDKQPQSEESDPYSGIGLANVRRRLELLYPGNFTLETGPQGEWFFAHLTLTLP